MHNHGVIANAPDVGAVAALSEIDAGSPGVEARGVFRGGDEFYAVQRLVERVANFVGADEDDDLRRAVEHGGGAIAQPVDVDDFTVHADGVGAGDEIVGEERASSAGQIFLIADAVLVLVDEGVASGAKHFQQADLFDGERTAEADGGPGKNHAAHFLDRLFSGFAEDRGIVPLFQVLIPSIPSSNLETTDIIFKISCSPRNIPEINLA